MNERLNLVKLISNLDSTRDILSFMKDLADKNLVSKKLLEGFGKKIMSIPVYVAEKNKRMLIMARLKNEMKNDKTYYSDTDTQECKDDRKKYPKLKWCWGKYTMNTHTWPPVSWKPKCNFLVWEAYNRWAWLDWLVTEEKHAISKKYPWYEYYNTKTLYKDNLNSPWKSDFINISNEQLKPWDIVVWPAPNGGEFGHVWIYAWNWDVIHAPTYTYLEKRSLDSINFDRKTTPRYRAYKYETLVKPSLNLLKALRKIFLKINIK